MLNFKRWCPLVSLQSESCPIVTVVGLVSVLLLPGAAFGQQLQPDDAESGKDWVYIQNDQLRLGLLRSHGGAIAYLSERGSDFNVLNHYDHGRLVQQSYYGDEDESRWVEKPWRYNPVQGGDYKGNAAKLVEFESTETTAFSKTVPRHWASGRLLEECSMAQQVELQGPVVQVRFTFHYRGSTTHRPRHQETPAVFVSPRLSSLVTYSGNSPWTGDSLTSKTPGWPNEHVVLSESWAAYVDGEGNGVGVYVPGVKEATSYRFEGGSGSNCSYVAPLRTFALTPQLKFSYMAYFTLGNAETIRDRFAQIRAKEKE